MLVDTHAHLAFPDFAEGLDDLVGRSTAAGVTRIISIGTDLEDSRHNLKIAEKFPGTVFAAVGIHPTSVHEIGEKDWIDQLRTLAQHPSAVAIGETGTDHFHAARGGLSEGVYRGLQAEFFEAQLQLATELRMPVVIHQRESLAETVRLLAPFHGKVRAVFHCFTGSWDEAAPLIAEDHLVSFTGIATFKSARTVQECVQQTPDGKFMLETDCPFLAPVPHRGKRNEPAFVRPLAEHVATLRNTSLDSLASQTSRTAEEFFGLT